MKKTFLRFSIFAALAVFLALAMFPPQAMRQRGLKSEGYPSWWANVTTVSDGQGHLRILNWLGPREAHAQQPAGGPAGGAAAAPQPGKLTGQATIAAGNTTIRVPAAGYSPAVYTNCFVSVLSPLPPVAGDLPGCAVTSTATIIASATATVGAINIQVAGTPSPSPVVMWTLTQ